MHAVPAYTPKVGDIVVLFGFVGGRMTPVSHNSREFPGHSCRGRVLTIGRKYVHVSSNGSSWKVLIEPTEKSFRILTPELAKPLYREALEELGNRSVEFINKCVDSL